MAYTKEQRNKYQKQHRHKIRLELINYLGGKCIVCQAIDQLEFDHKDPLTKTFTIASGLDKPKKILLAEVDKCQLLCKDCHLEKTAKEPSKNIGRKPWNKGKYLQSIRHCNSTGYNTDGCRCDSCLKWKSESRAKN